MLPFLIYLAGIFILVNPGLEGLMKPVVLIYAFSLVGMAIAAINRYGLTASGKFWLTLSGALLFLLSDSLLAYNKFIGETTSGGFIIMLTYIAAQYLIMRGLIFQRE